MKVLITGGSSLLGKALAETRPAGTDIAATWFTNHVGVPMYQMDVADKHQVAYIFDRVQPEIVIHCAAVGSVDYAEAHFTEAREINVEGTANVLRGARDCRAKFVYISTNAVFDGEHPPYSETSERQPVNRYGSIKREAEDLVMAANNWLIVRPFLLFGWTYPNARQNWATTILKNLMAGKPMALVDDVYWQPTGARDAARAIWQLVELSKPNQVYHVASPDRLTLYEFGQMVARAWWLKEELLTPVGAERFKGLAPRPRDTTYDTGKINSLGITVNSTEQGLKEMKN